MASATGERRRSVRTGRRRGPVLVVATIVAAVAVASLSSGGDLGRSRASNVAQLLAAGLASGTAAWHARSTPGSALHRWMVAAAAATWCLGQSIWTAVQWTGRPPPFPSMADAAFLATYPLLIVGFLRSPSSRVRRGTVRAALDWATITGSVVFVGWAAGLGTMIRGVELAPASLLSLSYPLLDLLVLSVLLAVITRCRRCRQTGVATMALGIGLLAVADSAFSYLTTRGEYATGSWVDLAWIAAWLLVAAASATGTDDVPDNVDSMPGVDAIATWAPVVALGAVAVAVVALQLVDRPFTDDALLFWLGLMIFVINVVRIAVAHGDSVAATAALNLEVTGHAERVAEYDAALLHAGTRMWRWDPVTDSITWSPSPDGMAGGDQHPTTFPGFVGSLHAEDRAKVRAMLEAALLNRGQQHELTYRRVGDGSELSWLRTSARYRDGTSSKAAVVLGLEVDVTAERAAAVRDARRLRETEALVDIGDQALRADFLQVFLDGVAAVIQEAVPAPLSKILRLDADAGHLVVEAGVGWRDGTVGHAVVHADPRSQAGYTLASSQAVVVTDLGTETRFGSPQLLRDHDVRSGISATIRTERGPWGVVGVHSTAATYFGDDDALFLAAVATLIGTGIDRLDAIERLRRYATQDDLTGLPNRALLLDRLALLVEASRRTGRYTAVVHAGIDRFGLVNETYGHGAGDAVLVDVAARLLAMAPPGATVARYGGDEFAVAALCAGPDGAADLAARVLAAMQAPTVAGEPPEEIFLSASVGLAVANGLGDPAVLLRDAAAATSAAAAQGGGRYQIHDPRFRERARRRLTEERELRRALDAGEFEAFFQPVVDLASNQTVGVEALARWRHPSRGILAPEAFLDRVIEIGLVNRLGEAVLESAVSAAARWPMPSGFGLAVNIAAGQLVGDTLHGQLRAAIAMSGFDPRHLVLEVVEDQMTELDSAARTLAEIKAAMPVRVHIDDFGTGHSSLARLAVLPIDGLKIDRSFVHKAAEHAENEVIVSTVIALARALGLEIIAEGIETEPQRAVLQRLGCRLGQGWLFAPALSGDEIRSWLPAVASRGATTRGAGDE